MPYSFGTFGPHVEIPEMDAFRTELFDLCSKYGLGFSLTGSYEGWAALAITSVDLGEWDLFENLGDYAGGVPFLDEARQRWQALQAEERERAREKQRETEIVAIQRRETTMKENGISLSDGVYRLVKDEQ